jgi:hypothetical protein
VCLHPAHYFKLHNAANNNSHNNNNNNRYHHDDDVYEDHITGSGSPVMYSNHAPMLMSIGLTKCEYCGSSNVNLCEGVREVRAHFGEYQRRMLLGKQQQHYATAATAIEEDTHITHDNNINFNHNDANSTTSNTSSSNSSHSINSSLPPSCPRPKLFFLKKRPPFANIHDGWNVQTQHRAQLFEPPSSMEGVGRGYGEVRGRLGDYCTVNYTSPKTWNNNNNNNTNNNNTATAATSGSDNHHASGGGGGIGNGNQNHHVMMNGYNISQRSHSLPTTTTAAAAAAAATGTTSGGGGRKETCGSVCGSVCGETEISFPSAAGSGGGGGRRSPLLFMMMNNNGNIMNNTTNDNNNDSDTGRSLSPLQWVNGSEIKGVMKWFA